eukprot:gnl/MRDRNA2_/MRDRNA2_110954_c0_seq1.p1 gnl/MRDRNA2_/MRDRNA2_110954_c0~~gnl/MRDRNA2_/MRDRNA2_110954_c0_seq1.p1  ORF type:complete len:360 (+),score=77.04 gnl/MRDRNA2_/MRDRNA2_110954_c0_seq1:108-1187(+)
MKMGTSKKTQLVSLGALIASISMGFWMGVSYSARQTKLQAHDASGNEKFSTGPDSDSSETLTPAPALAPSPALELAPVGAPALAPALPHGSTEAERTSSLQLQQTMETLKEGRPRRGRRGGEPAGGRLDRLAQPNKRYVAARNKEKTEPKYNYEPNLKLKSHKKKVDMDRLEGLAKPKIREARKETEPMKLNVKREVDDEALARLARPGGAGGKKREKSNAEKNQEERRLQQKADKKKKKIQKCNSDPTTGLGSCEECCYVLDVHRGTCGQVKGVKKSAFNCKDWCITDEYKTSCIDAPEDDDGSASTTSGATCIPSANVIGLDDEGYIDRDCEQFVCEMDGDCSGGPADLREWCGVCQ